ncbi:hypothetical protein Vadar_007068 [Vaccinium darrowii]|uniref:Uncharacterized protein n=1 Tax=Vaccinium darrowii TaxID=229202 RepID=A0ACB7XFY6_9ERIC|nr:hypothetical protein Vadar_007068 [Vaccinium darrowii]
MYDQYPCSMADFNADFPNPKPSHNFSLMNSSNMELLNNLGKLENLNSNVHGLAGLLDPMTSNFMRDNIPNSFHSDGPFYSPVDNFMPSTEGPGSGGETAKDRAQMDAFGISSHPISGVSENKKNYSYGGNKRKRSNVREVEKPREVVHVRAKRGQATDSHSLAERLRREKINEKLRSLQDLVPGCYKTMGMAVMLDVITNYVRSLQNQIEFLSMKLSAASLFYDFNSEMDAMETMQGTNGYETQGMERMVGGDQGYGDGGGGGEGEGGAAFSNYFPSSAWPSLT